MARAARPDAAADDAGAELCLLGTPRLRVGARSVALSPKDAALLCLVVRAGPVRTERVAALLWPQASQRQADTSLRQRLYRLRRQVHSPLVSSGALLEPAPGLHTDIAGSLEALADDEHAAAGELLGDLDYEALPDFADWLRGERARWREERQAALVAQAERCEKQGALARALAYASRHAEGDPLAEHGQRRLMRLHYLRGDRAAAIAAFERFEQRLKDELGLRPSAETLELLATIERAEPVRAAAARSMVPAGLMRPPRLIGRAAELDRLDAAWRAGRVFLLLGEAGIGKTRLLQELAAGRAGVTLVQARPGDAGVAYALAARALRALLSRHALPLDAERRRELALLLPEWGEPAAVAGEAQRLLVQRSVEQLLVEAMPQGLTALVADDLHFADDASVALLQALAQAEPLAALRWGLAQRPAEGGAATRALRVALEESQRIESVTLGPLTEAQLAELVASLGVPELDAPRLAPALMKHTGGNPLFSLETLKDLLLRNGARGERLPQPSTVAALVERRLSQLSAPALRLARTAALAGANFDAELAASVLEAHPLDLAEPWRELEAAQVIRDGAFAHDLIFEATRASVPAPIAQLLHQRIAAHLVTRGVSPAALAPHWAGAHEWARCGEAYAAAARQARSASQRTHEVECWTAAARAFDAAGLRTRAFDARCESVLAVIVVQGVGEAQRVIDTLLADAADDSQRAAALLARANASLMAADHASGIAAATEAARLSRHDPSPWPGFEAARLLAVGLTQAGRGEEALAAIEPYRALVEREGNAEQRGRFWADYAYALNGLRRLRDTAFAVEQGIAIARECGDLAELATMTSNLATVKGNLGQVNEALELAHRALALQTQLGATDGPPGAVVQTYVGLYCGVVGRYREALEQIDAALAVFERDRQATWIAIASHHKAQWLIDLGQFARARQALDYATPSVDFVRARGMQLGARIDRALGQSGQASMQRALATLGPGADPHVRMHVLLDDAPRDDPQAALVRCDEVLALATRLEFAGVAVKAQLRRAQALVAVQRATEAAASLRPLLERIDEVPPADLYLGEAWWIAAQVFDAAGDGDEALMALARGAQWVRRVALPNVPDEFRDSFLQRNPANRALLAAADRRLAR